ncbi:MAG TPA: SHOCT domain-containing protein [Ferruginibacter sp.]|nr:hypothetical protein [Chitinophagaceae bacterium]HRI25297.1 SHOCT domain-containing protein [Ferruginibacter sp.]
MKKLFVLLQLLPLITAAQYASPRFEHDTLFTSGGYKIYKGQVLQLGNGSSDAGYFRFVKFHTNMARNDTYTLQGSSILVKDLRQFKLSSSGNHTIRITGTATRKDKSTLEADVIMTFDKAIYGEFGLAPELVVPDEYRKSPAAPVNEEPVKQPAKEEVKKTAAPEELNKQPVPEDLKKRLVADEIKKLFDLYKAGALTKEEYEKQKKKLLEQ